MYDVQSKDGKEWFYTDEVKDHFFNPKNLLKTREEAEQCAKQASGIGEEGSPRRLDSDELLKPRSNREIH